MLTTPRERARIQQGRNPQPSAGIIDSQSVKGADTVGLSSRGYDAGKKINGRRRFMDPLLKRAPRFRQAPGGSNSRVDTPLWMYTGVPAQTFGTAMLPTPYLVDARQSSH
jgi:hypothetical protein